MSQMTATARPLRSPRRVTTVPPLRVIPSRIGTTGNGVFAATCIGLLTLGLVALLALNTALAQGSLSLGALKRESAVLGDSTSNLQEEINRVSAGGALARRASELGMVRANERAYINLAKGTVTGEAMPATSLQAVSIVTSPTPAPDAAKKIASAGKSASLTAKKVATPAKPAVPAAAGAAGAGAAAANPTAPAATPKTSGAAAGAAAPATLVPTPRAGQPAPTGRPTTPIAPR